MLRRYFGLSISLQNPFLKAKALHVDRWVVNWARYLCRAQQWFLACKFTLALVLSAFASTKLSIAGNSAEAFAANWRAEVGVY